MKQKICYNLEGLLKLLNGYKLKVIATAQEDDESAYRSFVKYFTNREDIVDIVEYHSFWTTKVVKFADGTDISLKSSNVNVDDKTILRINTNDIISPELIVNDNYVEATKDLVEWLHTRGISDKELKNIEETFNIYDIVEYPGVPTPIRHDKHWGYSDRTLVLDEREIETVLNGIEDIVLREKIKCILYARVFKKY